jgi:ATP-dependent DNA helicase PIF1
VESHKQNSQLDIESAVLSSAASTNVSDGQMDEMLSEEQTAPGERDTPCEFICGVAGSGKTYQQLVAVKADPAYGVLSAVTGIASVNLGAITIHSLLRYSTTDVLRDHYMTGQLVRVLHLLAKQYRRLIIDEISMADATQLDIWYRAVEEANRYSDIPSPMGITLVGDFAQLPPVKARWAFEAGCWPRFRENTTRLTKVWRQDGGPFLDALNLARRGDGAGAADFLASAGARFETALDTEFEGTTILPRNDQVGRFNRMALDRVPEKAFKVASRRWGRQQSEWGQSARTKEWGIPPEVELKLGAYVMLLANHSEFEYVNGDCGWVRDHADDSLTIELVRTGGEIKLRRLVRGVESSDRPLGWPASFEKVAKSDDDGRWLARPHYRSRVRRFVSGQVEFWPLRLAYASTVHKTQSLTLDRVQIDYRGHFFSQPAMVYVAMSRARSLEGLRLVGQRETLAKHCNSDPAVSSWL